VTVPSLRLAPGTPLDAANGVTVSVRGLRKSYGDHLAADDVSFDARRGEILGLLGPNGAGKTTTLECLEGIRQPDGGTLDVMGVDPTRQPNRLRRRIGVQLQSGGLPADMQVGEAMRFVCAYQGVPPRPDLLERLGLADKLQVTYRELSTGLRRRLALALAVAHRPGVVVLDEPTAGLDVASRIELHALMRDLADEGTTILLATHDMAEAEKMADRVAILLRGRVVATGRPRDLTATGDGLTKVSVRSERSCLHEEDVALPAVQKRLLADGYAVYFSTDPSPTVTAILAAIDASGDRLIDLRVERPSLEERFLEITTGGTA
jgi:ABC-2 type transport system ATP-binding protein